LEGKKCSRSISATSAGSEAPGKSGNLCGGRPNANLLAHQRERGVAEDRKSDQCDLLAAAMALKYLLLELFTLLQLRGDGSRRDSLANLWYSLLRGERRGDHHGFERGHGRLLGAWEVRREVRRVEEMSNHQLRELGVGLAGQGSVVKVSSAFPTASRSRRAQSGVGGGSIIAGGFSVITHGTWSEPVEGRGVSHDETRGERAVFAKARSKTEGREMVSNGNRVYTPSSVQKMIWGFKGGIKVAIRNNKHPFGQGAAGICQRVVKIKIT